MEANTGGNMRTRIGMAAAGALATVTLANCADHGWIVSRASIDEAASEGRAHLAQEHGSPSLALSLSTDHGPYDVLPARESDDAPAGATYTVFGDGGYIAGYASETRAWDKRGRPVGSGVPFRGIAAAAQYVSSCDAGWTAAACWDSRDGSKKAAAEPRESSRACRCSGCRFCDPCCCTTVQTVTHSLNA